MEDTIHNLKEAALEAYTMLLIKDGAKSSTADKLGKALLASGLDPKTEEKLRYIHLSAQAADIS